MARIALSNKDERDFTCLHKDMLYLLMGRGESRQQVVSKKGREITLPGFLWGWKSR